MARLVDPAAELLARYDRGLRADPPPLPGLAVENSDGVITVTGTFNFVSHWTIDPSDAARTVARIADRYREIGADLEWCVYDHDRPANLPEQLARQGFVVEETATLMAIQTEFACATIPDTRSDIRRVTDLAGLCDYLQVSTEAFGAADTWQSRAFSQRLNDPDLALFIAYVRGESAAAGRLEITRRAELGHLYGGGVSPPFRRRGLYADLVATRARHAREHGVTHLTVCARSPASGQTSLRPMEPATQARL